MVSGQRTPPRHAPLFIRRHFRHAVSAHAADFHAAPEHAMLFSPSAMIEAMMPAPLKDAHAFAAIEPLPADADAAAYAILRRDLLKRHADAAAADARRHA
jgi:hypothetical protein